MSEATTQADPDAVVDRLAELLLSDAVPENAMDISTLDGFMAAALAGPVTPHLGELLPWMLDGDGGGQEPQFGNEAEAEELIALIIQHWHDTAATLAEAPEDYEPIVYLELESEDGGEVSVIDEWCAGFALGLQLQDLGHEQLPDALKDMLGPIFLYGTEDGRAQLEKLKLSAEQHESIAEALPGIVLALREHFHAH